MDNIDMNLLNEELQKIATRAIRAFENFAKALAAAFSNKEDFRMKVFLKKQRNRKHYYRMMSRRVKSA